MASIRRTLSPVPRPGTLITGEVCQTASPLSRSSTCSQNQSSSSGGFVASLSGLLDSHALVNVTFSPRWSRPLDRSKSRVPIWRRAVLHFLVCFVFGVFVGVTSFISRDLLVSSVSKHQAFTFGVVSTAGDVHGPEHVAANTTLLVDGAKFQTDELKVEEQSANRFSYETLENQSLSQDIGQEFGKLLIFVTPTYARPAQAYHLNRLAYSLKLVQTPLLWIVVEWSSSQSDVTAEILRRTGVMYRHLACKKNESEVKDRIVHQRNMALSHIETHHLDGIVYFADEENIYSTDLFEQMQHIRRFGTWLVARQTGTESSATVEGPVCNGTHVIGWHTNDLSLRFRRFHAEIPGFAFNSTILWDPKRWPRPILEPIRHIDTDKDGLQASLFIQQVVEDENQMEGLPEGCSRVMVWRPNHVLANYSYPKNWFLKKNLDIVIPLE